VLRSAACAIITFWLHLILLAPFLSGVVGRSPPQHQTYTAGQLINRGDGYRVEAWIIEGRATEQSGSSQRQFPEPTLSQLSLSLPSVVVYVPPPIQEADVSTAKGGTHPADGSATRESAGSYLGLVNDRIDRAWQRPHVAIGAPVFSCRVRIDQDTDGTIQKLTLEECDDNVFWRVSLLNAIQRSSPLPAPPDPSLFRPTLHLVFKSTRYSRYDP
jgi:hypothetical protein